MFIVIMSAYVYSCADACCVATEYKLCFDKVSYVTYTWVFNGHGLYMRTKFDL